MNGWRWMGWECRIHIAKLKHWAVNCSVISCRHYFRNIIHKWHGNNSEAVEIVAPLSVLTLGVPCQGVLPDNPVQCTGVLVAGEDMGGWLINSCGSICTLWGGWCTFA